MSSSKLKGCLSTFKGWMFQLVAILDTTRATHPYLTLLMTIFELTVLHFLYMHPSYAFLHNFPIFKDFFNNYRSYLIHIVPFTSEIYSLLILLIYPFATLAVIVTQKIGPLKPLVIIIQLATYLYPLIHIKIILELVENIRVSSLVFLGAPLGIISLVFGGFALLLTRRAHRLLDIPLVIILQLQGSSYALLALLAIRLIILAYIFYPSHHCALTFCFQTSLYFCLFSCLFALPQALNYASFIVLICSLTLYGLYLSVQNLIVSPTIYDNVEALAQEEDRMFEILREIEEHQVDCNLPSCLCHKYLTQSLSSIRQFVNEYEQQRLKRRLSFEDRLFYAQTCIDKYEYRLNGLLRVYQHHAQSIWEEYQIFKISQLFETNLRKQDKNYKYGQVYLNLHEEEQYLNEEIHQILIMIRQFWELITAFDGTTKFLTLIHKISRAISQLQQNYLQLQLKYDEDVPNFKYLMDLFKTIILNDHTSEDDEVLIPPATIYIITSGQQIVHTNNQFALMVNRSIEQIIKNNYHSFIPQSYRDAHKEWVQEYIQKCMDYEDKQLPKLFTIDNFEVQTVEMNHKILPRFMNGLQVFTTIQQPLKTNDSFICLVDKEGFFIKNIQPSFYELTRFKVNQRSVKLLQELSLLSIFQSINTAPHITHQTKLLDTFLSQFTYYQIKDKSRRRRSIGNAETFNKNIQQDSNRFTYEVLTNVREDDPYLKIKFKPKFSKEIVQETLKEQPGIERPSEINQGRGKGKEEDTIDYHIPIYMVLLFPIFYLIATQGIKFFGSGLSRVENKYKFYVAFDETILFAHNDTVGSNQVSKLQDLWIQGYGNYSEAINAFLWVQDPFFGNYILTNASITFHNNLHTFIQEYHSQLQSQTNQFIIILLIITSVALLHFLLDFILSLRYIFVIQKKVGEMLLQFIVVDQQDIQQLLSINQNFSDEVLNFKSMAEKKGYKIPLQTVEESALQLLRGSPNSSGIISDYQPDHIVEKRSQRRRSLCSVGSRSSERASLSGIKMDFVETGRSKSGFAQNNPHHSLTDQIGVRQQNIARFKEQYASCSFVLKANCKLCLMMVVALLMSIGIILGAFLFVYFPAASYPDRINILHNLYSSKIVLLKSVTQISSNQTLLPSYTVSNNLHQNVNYVNSLTNSNYQQFKVNYEKALSGNVCQILDTLICTSPQNYSNIHQYGLNVIVQKIEQYYRQRNITAITGTDPHNTLITYSEALLSTLIGEYMTAGNDYHNWLLQAQTYLLIAGTVIVILSLLLNHLSLQQFKNRIEDTKSLLKIIPMEIKDKHHEEISAITEKELP